MEEEVVVREEEDLVVVMKRKVSQGTVRGNNMFSRMYSRKGLQQSSSPAIMFDLVVQQMKSSTIVSTFDQVVESESMVQPMVIHYTDPDTTFHDVMHIAFQITVAVEESIRTSPTTIPVEATDAAQHLRLL
ncbi:unnamed protein product [Linum tenue]|uniref:Uncharacterized protein n=1 Tax=Linum tenue TaxID=586396 RepID=A0AAV0MF72_9ROSI|nr:unnamed protein product [Linum tenue]